MNVTLPATKARQQFFSLIETVDAPGHMVTITLNGKAKVVMMSAEEFEGWQETLEIMSDKKLMKSIEKSLKEAKNGKLYTEAEIRKKLKL